MVLVPLVKNQSPILRKSSPRNVQISYIEVEGGEAGEELEDPYEGAIPTSLPHTVESFKIRELPPAFPTDTMREQLTKEDMALQNEDAAMVILDATVLDVTNLDSTAMQPSPMRVGRKRLLSTRDD